MVEEVQSCLIVLTRRSAMIAGSNATGLLPLADHIQGCVVSAGPDDRDAVLTEPTGSSERFTRSVG